MIDRKVRLLAREVLSRMSGCPDVECAACSNNRETIIRLVGALTGEVRPRLFCRNCKGRGQILKGDKELGNTWQETCAICKGDGLEQD